MSYGVPKQFKHGDYPTAADLNKLSASLTALEALLQTRHWAVAEVLGTEIQLNHRWRWLHYETYGSGSAYLHDPTAVNDNVSLPDSGGEVVAYDLSDIDWLVESQVYYLTGVRFAAEDGDA